MIRKLIAKLFGWNREFRLANIAEGTHPDGNITFQADAAQATRHVIVKEGSDATHVAVTTANTENPIGVCDDEADAAEDYVNVQILGNKPGTILIYGTATRGAFVTPAANGYCADLTTTVNGSYYVIGKALNTASGGLVEVQHCVPYLRVISGN